MQRNKEVEKAYHNAAESAENEKLIRCFRRRSDVRKKFGESLKIEVMASFPKGGGPKAGMDIRKMPSLKSGASMLKIFSKRARAEMAEYRKILEGQELPFEIYQIIRKHKMRIELDMLKSKDMSDLF